MTHDCEACLTLLDFVVLLAAFNRALQGWTRLLRSGRFLKRRVDTYADVCAWDQVCAAVLEQIAMLVYGTSPTRGLGTRLTDINVGVPTKSKPNQLLRSLIP